MKFGILINQTSKNLDDDIQSYSTAKLLPQVNYFIDTEKIDTFCSEENEPVGLITAPCCLLKKWNWPPSKCIYPLFVGLHLDLKSIYHDGTPLTETWIKGIGGKYLKSYGPVGAYDTETLKYLKKNGIPSYWSGSIVLTLPKFKVNEDAGTYICFSDINKTVKKSVLKKLEGTNTRVISVSHKLKSQQEALSVEERFTQVEEKLSLYQNAKCVITKDVTTAMACLAMEVPVLAVADLSDEALAGEWNSYKELVHFTEPDALDQDGFSYDFENPPQNPQAYIEIRQKLVCDVQRFLEECERLKGKSAAEVNKADYTDEDVVSWKNMFMKEMLEEWLHESRGMQKSNSEKEHLIRVLRKKLRKHSAPELTDFIAQSEYEYLKFKHRSYLKQLEESFRNLKL